MMKSLKNFIIKDLKKRSDSQNIIFYYKFIYYNKKNLQKMKKKITNRKIIESPIMFRY